MTVRIIDKLKQTERAYTYKPVEKKQKSVADYMEAYYRYLNRCLDSQGEVSVIEECEDVWADDYCDAVRRRLAKAEHCKIAMMC